VNDFPTSVDARTFRRERFKSEPLSHADADSVINPSHFLSRDACGNDVVDDSVDGTKEFKDAYLEGCEALIASAGESVGGDR